MNFLKDHLNIEVSDDDTSKYFEERYPHIFKQVESAKEKESKKKASKKTIRKPSKSSTKKKPTKKKKK